MSFNRWVQILYPLLVYYILYYALDAVFLIALGDRYGSLFALMLAGLVTAPVIYYLYRRLPIVKNIERITRRECEQALVWTAVVVAAGIALNLLAAVLPLAELSGAYAEADATLSEGGLGLRILSNVIVIPILEELVFRGIVLGQLSQWMMRVPAVLISAALFGILHFNVIQLIYAAVLGILLGYLYTSHRRLIWPILAHGLCNLAVIILSGI